MAMKYDHNQKSGNQGDVVKHVALIAAIDTILRDHRRADFRYADTFAGYAYNPLINGNEWNAGIGRVFGEGGRLGQNPHTKYWYEWYLQGRPGLLCGVYPGSSLIACDVCRLHDKRPSMSLWDLSPEVIANLMQTYSGVDKRIHCRSAVASSACVTKADFIFIDPPGLKSTKNKDYPSWQTLLRFLEEWRDGQQVLVWLPVKAVTARKIDGRTVKLSPPEEDEASAIARKDADALGCRSLRVRWASGGHTVGCLLISRGSERTWTAIEAAVKHVVGVAGWQAKLSGDLRAIE
jgi:23S rRNA A2030 N6-methylase RlmJ